MIYETICTVVLVLPPEQALALRRESGDRALELAGETARRVFLRRPDRLLELARRVLEQPRRLVLERQLQPLDLAALDVRELRVHSGRRLGLLAVDPLEQLSLARAQPVGHLLQRLPALRRDVLEVGRGRVDRVLGGALGLVTEAQHRRLVLAWLARDLLGLLPVPR